MPMGVASMSLTWRMPSASMRFTCAGSLPPAVAAARAGTRLSSTMVVLPEPDTPVTTVSRPLGMSASRGLTVWMASVAKRMARARTGRLRACAAASAPRRARSGRARSGRRGFAAICSSVPWAITRPPPAPASGPISISQSASFRIWVSWSTSSTELPSATRSRITPFRPTMLAGCRPMEGSSSTYSTPVVRLRTARASCIRWRSPVESVEAARSRVR